MKQGITFESLIAQVEAESQERHDFYAPMNQMQMMSYLGASHLQTLEGEFVVRESAHLHLAELIGIDRRYYNRLRQEAPDLLDTNINHWLLNDERPRLVRALGTEVRALASTRYATLDNDALLRAVEPIIDDLGATVESCDLNDDGMTLKLVTPKLQGEVAKGDVVQAGLVIKNSEVRAGALSVQPLIFRLVCTNGLILGGATGGAVSRRHIGRDWREDSEYFGAVPQSVERQAFENAIWSQLQANLRAAISADGFVDVIHRLRVTTGLQTTLEPQEIVQRISELSPALRLGPEVEAGIVRQIEADNYSGTLWDVINGITCHAQAASSYDVSTDLEALAGRLVAFNERDWDRLVSLN